MKFFIFTILISCLASADPNLKPNFQAIYGPDDRQDWSEVTNPILKSWARSTVVLISTADLLKEKSGSYKIQAPTYEEAEGLCPGSRFGTQLTPGFCSGFLVGDDLLLTAGHCLADQSECDDTAFVFDYAVTGKEGDPKSIASHKIFHCRRIVARELTDVLDYALVQLDRSTGRRPFPIRRHGQPVRNTKLTLIGHPSGLPSKISDGGIVTAVTDRIFADVDAFGGNSGSVVINRRTGRAEGILMAGAPDFERVGKCRIEKVCGPDCEGEEVFPISTISYLIPE